MLHSLMLISPLSAEAQAALSEIIEEKPYKRNTHLLKIGGVSHYMYFVNEGVARVYYEVNGLDVTDYFAIDGQFIGGVDSLFSGRPSKKGIQLLEDSTVLRVNYRQFEELCTRHHDIERVGRKMAIFAFLEGQQRIESIRFHEAKERYEVLNQKYPGLINRCPLKYIASYLGITQVSLSRIRASAAQ
ncbi:MAG: Crp/Fnr family transcriptional regulator [Bacteroidetes bacterium]|nr:MAG: Crp/Fnr family transcriptional regulator [Bacteroidota bacterium]